MLNHGVLPTWLVAGQAGGKPHTLLPLAPTGWIYSMGQGWWASRRWSWLQQPWWDSVALIHHPFLPQTQAAPAGSHDNSTPGKDQPGGKK